MFVWRETSEKYHIKITAGTLCRISKLNTTLASEAITGELPPEDRVLCSNCQKAIDGIREHKARKAAKFNCTTTPV